MDLVSDIPSLRNTNLTRTIVILEYFQCLSIELPESNIDCSRRNSSVCVKCEIRGAYLSEPNIAVGELTCQILLLISVMLGVLGVFTNLIISCVFYKRKTKRAVDFLLLIFGLADFLSCFSSIFTCLAPVFYLSKL